MRIPGSCPCSLLARSQCSQSCASMSFHIPLSWSTLLPNALRPSTPCPRNPTPPPAHGALPPADRLSRAHHRKQSLCSLCPAVKQLSPFLPQWVKRTFQRHRRGGARRQCACQMCCVSARESELWRERGWAPRGLSNERKNAGGAQTERDTRHTYCMYTYQTPSLQMTANGGKCFRVAFIKILLRSMLATR